MRLFSLAFLLGVLFLQNFTHLPAQQWIWILLIIAIIIVRWNFLRLALAFILGFAWCLWYAHHQMSWTLPENLEGKTILVKGNISSIPDISQHKNAFLFSLQEVESKPTASLLRLSWHSKNPNIGKQLHVGDQWEFKVRLKKIHGLMNPGGFDYEAWALQGGIRAHGYIVDRPENKLLSCHWYIHPIDRAREFLKTKIENHLPRSNTSPWIVALSLGERHGIDPENWEVLRNTGTNHLMAIAGLHIGFMSGFVFSIVVWVWRRTRFCLRIPAQHAGSIAALLMALIYSAMAGFSLPTQRACIMLTVFLAILLMRRKMISWQGWSLALLLVLLLNPLSVLTESFWLSFGAVVFIIYGISARLSPKGLWWKWGRIQWVIAVGLVPFGIWLFQEFSLISFVANSIAIPWVGFLIVPLCLLGSFLILFSGSLGGFILIVADKLLSILWSSLTWFAHLSWGSWYLAMPNIWILLAACLGMFLLLLPIGFPGRFFGGVWLLPLFFHQTPVPKPSDVWLTLLDVGQGLATVVQTTHHILVFDTGAKLSPSFDMGESVVLPFLRSIEAKKVDMLVVSHGDNDHIGGAGAILKRLPVSLIKTSVPEKFSSTNTNICLRGETWNWDGVNFKFLYPSREQLNLGNDSSCVLRITSGNNHILLTGDIEKFSENYLVDREGEKLKSDILVAPHHGSKTSGVDEFINYVNPQFVLFPIGYRNRYHFPHSSVVAKYDVLGAQRFDSVSAGSIKFLVSRNQPLARPILFREIHHRYWNDK